MMTSGRPRNLLALALLTLLASRVHAQKVPFEDAPRPIPWVENRMGRFFQSNQWTRLDELSRNALEVAIENNLTGLKTQAQWYRTLVVAQNGGTAEDVFAELQKAFEYGYRSVQGIESADQLAMLRADAETAPKFRALVSKLKETIATEAKARFESAVALRIDKARKMESSSLGVDAISKPDGKNLGEVGRPMIVVLSRTYHAGFRKQWPALESAARPFADRITHVALFYENDVQDSFIQQEVARFAEMTGVGSDEYAVIDRETFKRLRDAFSRLHEQLQEGAARPTVFDLYFPFTFIVDAAGRPLFAESGNLNEGEIAFAIEKSLEGLPEPQATEEKADEGAAEKKEAAEEEKKEGSDASSDTDKGVKAPEKTGDADKAPEKTGDADKEAKAPEKTGDADQGDADESDQGDAAESEEADASAPNLPDRTF